MDIIHFTNTLKKLRNDHNMTQKDLADRLGLVKSTVAHYESGDKFPSYDSLIKIATLYNVSTDYLLGIQKNQTINLDGLSDSDIALINNLVSSLKKKSNIS